MSSRKFGALVVGLALAAVIVGLVWPVWPAAAEEVPVGTGYQHQVNVAQSLTNTGVTVGSLSALPAGWYSLAAKTWVDNDNPILPNQVECWIVNGNGQERAKLTLAGNAQGVVSLLGTLDLTEPSTTVSLVCSASLAATANMTVMLAVKLVAVYGA